jgi:DoxX-like family
MRTNSGPAEAGLYRRNEAMLWTIQGLLAALFLFAGGVKLVLPVEAMQQGPVALPGPFLRFIGVCEVSGAVGLVLPWLFRIRPALTPLAASGLIVIMIGATVITALSGPIAPALFPLIVGVMLTVVAYQRTRCTV